MTDANTQWSINRMLAREERYFATSHAEDCNCPECHGTECGCPTCVRSLTGGWIPKLRDVSNVIAEAIDLVREFVEILDPEEGSWSMDLSVCDYYKKYNGLPYENDGLCGFGCSQEPECITCHPSEGWPLERARGLLASLDK